MKMKAHYTRLVCNDGFSMSVQASKSNYCEPRNNEGPYISVECGFPSEKDPRLIQYAENPDSPTETVYGWVPSSVILEIIEDHGGWESGELPPMTIAP